MYNWNALLHIFATQHAFQCSEFLHCRRIVYANYVPTRSDEDPMGQLTVRKLLFALVAITLVHGTPPSHAKPNGDKLFYLPPSPLSEGEPGSVIRSVNLTNAAALPSAARNILVLSLKKHRWPRHRRVRDDCDSER